MKTETNPIQRRTCQPLALSRCKRCGAKARNGSVCRSPAVSGKARCRMHGGALGSGAPRGERNGAYRTGNFTRESIAERRMIAALLAESRGLAMPLTEIS
jgi:hypothetical protein